MHHIPFYGRNSFLEILYVGADRAKDQEIINIMKEYLEMQPKKARSFVDASLIYVAKIFSAGAILSFNRHFERALPYYE